ncbi:MAG: DNA polymerase IV, partial [Caulobacter sp.]|nr:DNA polymerase IV [Vitreoscilla sp.]
GYVGRTIGIKLRFDDFKTVTRDQSIAMPTADPAEIRQLAGQCLKRVDLTRRLRLLGVRVGGLSRPGAAASGPARGAKGKSGGQASAARPKEERPDEPTLF